MNLAALVTDPAMGAVPFTYGTVTETISPQGRAVFTEERFDAVGCLQPAPGKEREVLEEADRHKAALLLFTAAPLTAGNGPAKASRIYHQGGVYRVALVEPWEAPGGFCKAIAVLEVPE